jgi:uncharacterized membrane protein SpoIIM required for sporulation
MAIPIILVALSLGVGGWIGVQQAEIFTIPAQAFDLSNLEDGFVRGVEGFDVIRFYSVKGISAVWLQNLRAIALATIMGLFTFGVVGILVFMLPFVLIGYFVATAANLGISPWVFLVAFVLPHGIFEIPAIILAGGAALRVGATLTAPAKGRTMSEALLESFADWARVMVALILPLMLVAAFLEIYLTPRVAIQLLGP